MSTQTQELNQRDFLLNFDYTNDREVRFIPKDKPLGTTSAYLSIKEMAQLSEEVNDAAVVLMTYYFRKVKTPKFDFFDDEAIALALGWTVRKTKATRQLLVKADWLKRITFSQPTTKAKITVFYVGKEMCRLVTTAEEFSSVENKRKPIMNYFGLSSWEEVMATKSYEEIIEASMLFN